MLAAAPPQAAGIPPPGPATWTCPIDDTHRFTGAGDAFARYLEHFETGAIDDSGLMSGPHTATTRDTGILLPRAGENFVEVDVRGLFGSLDFVQVSHFRGEFAWRRTSPGFAFYVLTVAGAGADKREFPDLFRFFNALGAGSGTQLVGGLPFAPQPSGVPIPPDNVEVQRVAAFIRIQPLPSTAGTDLIVNARFGVRGYVR